MHSMQRAIAFYCFCLSIHHDVVSYLNKGTYCQTFHLLLVGPFCFLSSTILTKSQGNPLISVVKYTGW